MIAHILRNRNINTSTYAASDSWFHYDQVGSVMLVSNSVGTLQALHHQDAWGNVMSAWDTGYWAADQSGWHHNTKATDGDLGLIYMYQRWYSRESGFLITGSPYPSYWEERYAAFRSEPNLYADPAGRISITGGTPAQQGLVQEAWTRACSRTCRLNPSALPPGADPSAAGKVFSSMERVCAGGNQKIIIGGNPCDDTNVQGYTRCGPLNPFCGEGGAIHMRPDWIFDTVEGERVIDQTLMHELSHNCGVGEKWAYPIGNLFL